MNLNMRGGHGHWTGLLDLGLSFTDENAVQASSSALQRKEDEMVD
jgi:hypothetical protein